MVYFTEVSGSPVQPEGDIVPAPPNGNEEYGRGKEQKRTEENYVSRREML